MTALDDVGATALRLPTSSTVRAVRAGAAAILLGVAAVVTSVPLHADGPTAPAGAPLLDGSVAADTLPPPLDLRLIDMKGRPVQLRDLRGGPVVLNFWATWCVPCREEMPLLTAVHAAYVDSGVHVIAASLDDNRTARAIPRFVRRYDMRMPVWLGADATLLERLDLGEAIPATLILDAQGAIRFRLLGQLRRGEIEARLDWLRDPESGSAPRTLVEHLKPR